jgi:hypothetical protein
MTTVPVTLAPENLPVIVPFFAATLATGPLKLVEIEKCPCLIGMLLANAS